MPERQQTTRRGQLRSGKGFCDSSMARIKRFQWMIEMDFFFNHASWTFRKKLEIEGFRRPCHIQSLLFYGLKPSGATFFRMKKFKIFTELKIKQNRRNPSKNHHSEMDRPKMAYGLMSGLMTLSQRGISIISGAKNAHKNYFRAWILTQQRNSTRRVQIR